MSYFASQSGSSKFLWVATAFLLGASTSTLDSGVANAQAVYFGIVQGDVAQVPFKVPVTILLCPTVAKSRTQNGLNPIDIEIMPNVPEENYEVGRLYFSTNNGSMRARGGKLDNSYVQFDRMTGILEISYDTQLPKKYRDASFTALSETKIRGYLITEGQIKLQFDTTRQTFSGTADFWGENSNSSKVRYTANISAKYNPEVNKSCLFPE